MSTQIVLTIPEEYSDIFEQKGLDIPTLLRDSLGQFLHARDAYVERSLYSHDPEIGEAYVNKRYADMSWTSPEWLKQKAAEVAMRCRVAATIYRYACTAKIVRASGE